jgi:hypothetical protein
MGTLLLLGAVALGLVIGIGVDSAAEPAIPEWYYSSPCQMPAGETLEHWLPWALPIEDYERNVFDCSDLSAYAEWLAENCGYDTVIAVTRPTVGKCGHAWVVIEGRTLDAETGVWDADPWLPLPEMTFEDIGEAVDYADEWSWWTTYPELRGE